jgi:pyruvate/oxaloacetate carboxyltransferase
MSCIYPEQDLDRWSYCDNTVVLANADYYFTKEQTEELIDGVSGMTPEQVQRQIDNSIRTKADKSEVNELAEQVRQNTQAILNTYTKQETNDLLSAYLTKLKANEMFANYSKIENTTLILNSENIN